MLRVLVLIQAWSHHAARRATSPASHGSPTTAGRARRRWSSDRGQTTAEYALVLVGVAAIALLVLAWATESGAIGRLFDFILSHIMGQVH